MTYEEEIDTRDGEEVDDGEDNVASVIDVGDHRRRDLHNQESEQPLRHDCKGTTAETKLQRKDLTWVDPHVALPSQRELENRQKDVSAKTGG